MNLKGPVSWISTGQNNLQLSNTFVAKPAGDTFGFRIPSSASTTFSKQLTIEAWASISSGTVIHRENFATFPVISGNSLSGSIVVVGSGVIDFSVNMNAGLHDWHHFALTFDGFTLCVYADAKRLVNQTVPNQQTSTELCAPTSDFDVRSFDGKLGGIKVSSVALTKKQLQLSMMSLHSEFLHSLCAS